MHNDLLADAWIYDLSLLPSNGNCVGCGYLFRMSLLVNVTMLACEQEYIHDFTRVVSRLFKQNGADNLESELSSLIAAASSTSSGGIGGGGGGSSSTSTKTVGQLEAELSQLASQVTIEMVRTPQKYNSEKPVCKYKCENNAWKQVYVPSRPGATREEPEEVSIIVSVTDSTGLYRAIRDWSSTSFKTATTHDPRFNPEEQHVTVSMLQGDETVKSCFNRVKSLVATSTTCDDSCVEQRRQEQFKIQCLQQREARIKITKLDPNHGCQQNCVRGLCQFRNSSKYAAGEVFDCFQEGVCGGDDAEGGGRCSLPGRRFGHSASSFNFNGGPAVLLIFGGETLESKDSTGRILSNDVFTGYFDGSSLTWVRLNVDCPEESSCPQPRRDAAISSFDSRSGSSGKIIIFGGFAGALSENYLNSIDASSFYSLNDLWFLDLDQLDADGNALKCLQRGICLRSIKWVQMDVPGSRPASRFAAGMSILDQEGQGLMYLTGGSTTDGGSTSDSTTELNDLFLFQLRDPYFARCSATGKGLATAVAGQTTPFFIACTDLLGVPANGAQFSVTILPGASCGSGCPSSYPQVVNIDQGLYRCAYTPKVAGEYQITIMVGRGGSRFQEPVGGDAASASSTDDAVIREQLAANPKTYFNLLVLAAPTSQMASKAYGKGLTLSTAGIVSEFVLYSVDSFENRRPGGEDISVVMTSAKVVGQDGVKAGKVEDNRSLVKHPETLFPAYYPYFFLPHIKFSVHENG